MYCSNCDGKSFIRTEYRMRGLRAPALECASCHVLHLDEAAVRSEEERESVRLAVAERARLSGAIVAGIGEEAAAL